MSDNDERTAYWGDCDNGHSVVVYPTVDSGADIPDDDEDEWESGGIFSSCYVCGGSINWGGADPAKDIIRNYW